VSTLDHLHAGVPVTDLAAAVGWWTRFFGRPPDFEVSDERLWEVTERGWMFIEPDAARAGSGRLTITVTGLDTLLTELAGRGVDHGPVASYANGVRHVAVPDPDGNRIALAELPPEA
jgi:catechol 2,3-dioxygenase-like lactoylglutathione lyase family enzyme